MHWTVTIWQWAVAHWGIALAGLAILISIGKYGGPTVKWWYEVKKLRREEAAFKLQEDKDQVLLILRSEIAYAGLHAQTTDEIISNSNPKFSRARVETVLRSLANENPPRVHCFGGGWYLGPLPAEVAVMLLKK
jgi:hypothetical protein